MSRHTIRWLLLALLLAAAPAHALRSDRDQPTQILAHRLNAAELKQVAIYTGDVVLTKGTLRITGDRLELREDPEGYQYAVMTAAPGHLASFRQQRDPATPGVEEFIEAEAERLEYDGRNETIKLIGRAQVKRIENGEPRDEFRGGVITYNLRDSTYSGQGDATAGGRTRTIIAPRTPPSSAPPAPLAPARTLEPEPKK